MNTIRLVGMVNKNIFKSPSQILVVHVNQQYNRKGRELWSYCLESALYKTFSALKIIIPIDKDRIVHAIIRRGKSFPGGFNAMKDAHGMMNASVTDKLLPTTSKRKVTSETKNARMVAAHVMRIETRGFVKTQFLGFVVTISGTSGFSSIDCDSI